MDMPELEKASGAPAWMATFADLMSLLLCFFVLLFSFSQLDALKFKQIAGSMKMGFGVQRDVVAEEIPLGTSAVLDQFSLGQPRPTPFDEVKQDAKPLEEQAIHFTPGESDLSGGNKKLKEPSSYVESRATDLHDSSSTEKRIRQKLHRFIEDGAMDLENLGQ